MMQGQQHTASLALTNQSSGTKPKSSLNLITGISTKSNAQEYSVSFWKGESEPIKMQLAPPISVIGDLVVGALTILNMEYQMGMDPNPENYKLYAAKKSGKRKSDLPAFDLTQVVEKTKVQNFCLELKAGRVSTLYTPIDIQPIPEIDERKQPKSGTEVVQSRDVRQARDTKLQKTISGSYDLYNNPPQPQRKKSEVLPEQNPGCFCWAPNKPKK